MNKPNKSAASVWQGQENNFDLLRLLLAVLVIYSHSFPLGTGSEIAEPVRRLTHGQMTGGAIAVDLFFIMSGFLITASAERSSNLLSFMRKRVARIYPAFTVSALLSFLLVVPFSAAVLLKPTWLGRLGDLLLQTLRLDEFHYAHAFMQNPYPGAINGSVWSIQFEFWCYVGVALLSAVGLLRRRAAVLTLFLSALLISALFLIKGWIFGGKLLGVIFGSPQLWARLLPFYLAGVVFYLFRDRIRLHWALAWLCVAALLAACWLPLGWTVLFPIAGTYLIFYLAFAPYIKLHHVGRFGDFSYGTYLYAFPIQQILMRLIGHVVAPWVLFVTATPLTLVAAVASWYGVERRFLRPARRKETVVHAIEAEHAEP